MPVYPAKSADGPSKGAFNWWIQRCAAGVHPVDAPKLRRFVVQAKAGPLVEVARLRSTVVDVSKAAKDELHGCGRSKFVPPLAPNQALAELPMVNEPAALKEVKVLRAVRAQAEHVKGWTEQARSITSVIHDSGLLSGSVSDIPLNLTQRRLRGWRKPQPLRLLHQAWQNRLWCMVSPSAQCGPARRELL